MKKKEPKNKLQLQKAQEAIFVEGSIGLLARKCFNVLLFHALKKFELDEFHLKRSELSALIGYNSHDDESLKDALGEIMSTRLEWDTLGAGKKPFHEKSPLLSYVGLSKGKISYSFHPKLKEKLLCPTLYTWLKLEPMKAFSSKYSLTLWEILSKFEEVESTGFKEIREFRKLLGAEGKYFDSFMKFNAKVLKPSVLEINRYAEFTVAMECRRTGRKISHIKFIIKPNKQPSLFGMNQQLQISMNPEKDLREQSRKCFHSKIGNFGNCGSRYSNHLEPTDICHFCEKFNQNKVH